MLAQNILDRRWSVTGLKTLIEKCEVFHFGDLGSYVGSLWSTITQTWVNYYYIIIHAFITFSSGTESDALASLGGQHGKGLMGYLKRWVFRRRLKVLKVGESLILKGTPFQTVGAK